MRVLLVVHFWCIVKSSDFLALIYLNFFLFPFFFWHIVKSLDFLVHVRSPYILFDPLDIYLWTFVIDLEVVLSNNSTYRPLMPFVDFGALINHLIF